MNYGISVVINTLNEEKNIKKAIESVKWADEILVCDMYSEDKTREIAEKLGVKIILHQKTGYVEPARNFAISKASNDWVLILDADEEIGNELKDKLQEISTEGENIYVKIPRKNIIFNKWIKSSNWWPDYQIRFFKKGSVIWKNEIHQVPNTIGKEISLPKEEKYALIHNHYSSVFQYVERMNRYSSIQADELIKSGYVFKWMDIIEKPLQEFLSRYFAFKGYEDGLHGLALSMLQAFSFLIVYLKVWENSKFYPHEIKLDQINTISKKVGKDINYWLKFSRLPTNPLFNFTQRIINKFK